MVDCLSSGINKPLLLLRPLLHSPLARGEKKRKSPPFWVRSFAIRPMRISVIQLKLFFPLLDRRGQGRTIWPESKCIRLRLSILHIEKRNRREWPSVTWIKMRFSYFLNSDSTMNFLNNRREIYGFTRMIEWGSFFPSWTGGARGGWSNC